MHAARLKAFPSVLLSAPSIFYQAPFIDPPAKTNQIPRQVPAPPLVAHPVLLFLSAGARSISGRQVLSCMPSIYRQGRNPHLKP